MNKDIINFVKESRLHGVPDPEIKQELLSAGWEAHVVVDNFVHLKALTDKPLTNKDEDLSFPNHEKPDAPQDRAQKNEYSVLTANTPTPKNTKNIRRNFTKQILFLLTGLSL